MKTKYVTIVYFKSYPRRFCALGAWAVNKLANMSQTQGLWIEVRTIKTE